MCELAAEQAGYLGVESARGASGLGVTVSYWRDEAAAAAFRRVAEHAAAQRHSRERWYSEYRVRVATVTREYGRQRWPNDSAPDGHACMAHEQSI
jgi:heme-degrading monooxygenase HmoA